MNSSDVAENFRAGGSRCILCSAPVSKRRIICDSCRMSMPKDHLSHMDSLYMLTMVSTLLAFLILTPGSPAKNIFATDMEGMKTISIILLSLNFLVAILLVFQTRLQLQKTKALGIAGVVIGTLMLTTAVFNIIFFESSLGSFVFTGILSVLGVSILLGSVYFSKPVKKVNKKDLYYPLILLTGVLLYQIGFSMSYNGMGSPRYLWMLNGEGLLLMGALLVLISSISSARILSLPERTSVPSVLWAFSMITACFSLGLFYFELDGGLDTVPFILSQVFLLLIIASGALIRRRMTDAMAERSHSEIDDALSKAISLIKKNKPFYALLQLDRALRENPVSGLGEDPENGNILFTLEGSSKVREYSRTPGEYDIAFNEKAKVLSSQGRFSEAVKEYSEAIKREPNYLSSYMNIAMLLASIPGRSREAERYFDYLIASKTMYAKRWMRVGMPFSYQEWMSRSFDLYASTMRKKMDILKRIGIEGDVWGYYSVVRY